jgi:hypothetical protein
MDSPVSLLSADFSNSTATARGGMYVMDVRASLSLRNATQRRIRGITLAVFAQAMSGKGSVSVPSLDVGPGETFSVRIDNHLLRPGSAGPSVEVRLDGVLFDDLSFYGTDAQVQRAMTQWELQAQRDRKYFKELLARSGTEALRQEVLIGLANQASQTDRRQPGVQIVRGRATAQDAEREVQVAFVSIPDSPVEAMNGSAKVSDREARAPRFTFRNRSRREVQHVEIGWIIRDEQGREFYAATMPADLKLAPNQTGEVRQENALRFDRPVAIRSVTGYISGVEFSGGGHWIPPREAFAKGRLEGLAPVSPEESRLLQLYNRRGLDALIEELKKF